MSLLDKTWFGGGVEKFFGSQSFVRARITAVGTMKDLPSLV